MPFIDVPPTLSSFVKGEYTDFKFCRTNEILITGQNLTAGTVVGKITASGKLTQVNLAAGDGSEVAYGVLLTDVDATSADQNCVTLERGPLVLIENGLTYPAGATAGNIATINAALLTKNIRVVTAG